MPLPRILIVIDNRVSRGLLSRALASRGYEVLLAEHATDAHDQAQQKHPDAVLLDMALPAPGAEDVARRLQESELTNSIPIMALTVDARPESHQTALDAGCRDSIPKPVHVPELDRRLRQALNPAVRNVA